MHSQSGVVSVKRVPIEQMLAIQWINWNGVVSQHLFLVTELRAIADSKERSEFLEGKWKEITVLLSRLFFWKVDQDTCGCFSKLCPYS